MTRTDKREEILHAALELIAENGFHGAPMAMIAERAGVGAGTIYRYFENKDVLINVLYQELESRIRPVLMVGYATDKPIRERFIHLGSAWLKYFIDHPLDFVTWNSFTTPPTGSNSGGTNCWERRGIAGSISSFLPRPSRSR
ncbi:hypothetical protein JCM30471_21530 [Desulfuromonas carbonis]